MRLSVAVAREDAARALVELTPLLGGCREREVSDLTLLDFWAPETTAPTAADLEGALARAGVRATVGAAGEHVDWRAAIRSFHLPLRVGRLRVRPPWEPAEPGTLDVSIDPGMAFGTGQHATTRGCLELLEGLPLGSVLDIGCGSGVLAIAAARLGHRPVVAIDLDPDAVEATTANTRANGVEIDVRLSALGVDAVPAADIVLANLTLTDLLALARALAGSAPRHVVASGVRRDEVEPLLAEYAALSFRRVDAVHRDGWSAVLMDRTA